MPDSWRSRSGAANSSRRSERSSAPSRRGPAAEGDDGRSLVAELGHRGFARIRHPLLGPARSALALEDARAFFGRARAEKERLSIERSPHFRGYSEMKSERDWREQIHLGRERPPSGARSAHGRLDGPNLWPDDPGWRARMLGLLDDLERAGRDVLRSLAVALGAAPFLTEDEEPYLLLKLIHYLPEPAGVFRNGVAPHVDFSWITLVLFDGPGLEARTPDGAWVEVPPVEGTLVVNVGELLETATGGRLRATPHRVVIPPGASSRVSMPFFLNAGLSTRVPAPPRVAGRPRDTDLDGHVHRVLPDGAPASFVFGEAEWRRKGLGVWCADCVGRSGRSQG